MCRMSFRTQAHLGRIGVGCPHGVALRKDWGDVPFGSGRGRGKFHLNGKEPSWCEVPGREARILRRTAEASLVNRGVPGGSGREAYTLLRLRKSIRERNARRLPESLPASAVVVGKIAPP